MLEHLLTRRCSRSTGEAAVLCGCQSVASQQPRCRQSHTISSSWFRTCMFAGHLCCRGGGCCTAAALRLLSPSRGAAAPDRHPGPTPHPYGRPQTVDQGCSGCDCDQLLVNPSSKGARHSNATWWQMPDAGRCASWPVGSHLTLALSVSWQLLAEARRQREHHATTWRTCGQPRSGSSAAWPGPTPSHTRPCRTMPAARHPGARPVQ